MRISNGGRRLGASAWALIIAAGLSAPMGRAWAADAAPPKDEAEVSEVIVTGQGSRAATVAPVRSALTATEPQAIITRKFIEEAAPRVGDFSSTVLLAPGISGVPSSNGAGLSDGGKITLRGFSDGQYNITYDGIAWGDTNGPSHHGTAFFPASTIGGVIIDRGPGAATDLGQANFGGSINLLSPALDDERSLSEVATVGSWNTWQSVTNLQSGTVPQLANGKFLGVYQQYGSDGYLSHNSSHGSTLLLKGVVPITDRLTVTGLFTRTHNFYNKSDIGDASVAQQELYGPSFSLSNDPTMQNYYGYNWAAKKTDFEYVKLAGDLGGGFGLDETVYSYGYNNETLTGANNLATASANKVTLTPGPTYPAPGAGYSASLQVNGVPGYEKLNLYRVTGDILKLTKAFDFGTLTVGGLYEVARTQRFIHDLDLLSGQPDYRQKAAKLPGPSGVYVQVPLNIQYDEYSGWHQYQTFAQFEWRPTEALTVTPGVKHVNFDLYVHAPAELIGSTSQPLFIDQTYTKTLPFLTANYRLRPNWSVYAQYAQGFLVPKIGNLYVGSAEQTKIVPQESTNYQLGSVFQAGRLSVDGDVYYIEFKHKIQSFTDAVTGQVYDTNSGGATYRGVEVQGTYLVTDDLSVFGNWSLARAIGKDDPSNPLSNGHQLTGVPDWTAAAGVRFEHDQLLTDDDNLIVTLNSKWIGPQWAIAAKCSSAPNGICASNATLTPVTGRLPTINTVDLSVTYRVGRYSLEGQVINLTDRSDITAVKGSALIPGTDQLATTSAQGGGQNAFQRLPPRNYQLTLKVKF
jgi:iron complex outermembrane receptor protein